MTLNPNKIQKIELNQLVKAFPKIKKIVKLLKRDF